MTRDAGRPAGAPIDDGAEARAWGWVAHLRGGGTTPWLDWTGVAPTAERAGPYLPSAQQLELLRRLNAVQRPSAALAERVLTASAPGRGRQDLELIGVLVPSDFGPAPVDPSGLPEDELVRVATMLIAEDVVAAGEPAVTTRRTRVARRRYRILGDPELADPVRDALIADGRPPAGRSAEIAVMGTDVARMMTDAWTARCFGGGAPPWPHWCAAQVRRGALPARIDLAGVADHWAGRVGHGRIHVVLDPGTLPSVVGGRRGLAGVTRRPDLSADAVELARRTAPVLGLLVNPEARARLLRGRLRPWLEDLPGPSVVVPERHRAWLADRATDLRDRVVAGDYAVHGDLAALAPVHRPGVAAPSEEGVLALAMRVLFAQQRDQQQHQQAHHEEVS
jgi:hypothetical protein